MRYGDKVAEWLRRWTANPFPYGSMGSNPILVVNLLTYRHHKTLFQTLKLTGFCSAVIWVQLRSDSPGEFSYKWEVHDVF